MYIAIDLRVRHDCSTNINADALDILFAFTSTSGKHWEVVFDMVPRLGNCTGAAATVIKAFCATQLAELYTVSEKQQIVTHWLAAYRAGTLTQQHSVYTLRYLITPMLTWTLAHEEYEVLNADLVRDLVQHVFQNPDDGAFFVCGV